MAERAREGTSRDSGGRGEAGSPPTCRFGPDSGNPPRLRRDAGAPARGVCARPCPCVRARVCPCPSACLCARMRVSTRVTRTRSGSARHKGLEGLFPPARGPTRSTFSPAPPPLFFPRFRFSAPKPTALALCPTQEAGGREGLGAARLRRRPPPRPRVPGVAPRLVPRNLRGVSRACSAVCGQAPGGPATSERRARTRTSAAPEEPERPRVRGPRPSPRAPSPGSPLPPVRPSPPACRAGPAGPHGVGSCRGAPRRGRHAGSGDTDRPRSGPRSGGTGHRAGRGSLPSVTHGHGAAPTVTSAHGGALAPATPSRDPLRLLRRQRGWGGLSRDRGRSTRGSGSPGAARAAETSRGVSGPCSGPRIPVAPREE